MSCLRQGEQVGWHLEVHADEVRRIARHAEHLALRQLAELDRAVPSQPVGRVVGLARLDLLELRDHGHRARSAGAPTARRRGGALELLRVAAADDEQLGGGVARMAGHGDRGAAAGGQVQARHALARPAPAIHGMALAGICPTAAGKDVTAKARQRTEPRRYGARGLQLGSIGRARKHDGQAERAGIAPVDKGSGGKAGSLASASGSTDSSSAAVVAHVGPQAGACRVLAVHGVVADQPRRSGG